AEIDLPPQFEIIIVPEAMPQTKPKALNYALHFARGDLVVIFDAEDIPEPDQLRKAAETFAAAPPELVCLQARLTFYNANENWLTRQFTIEYAVLFDLVLPFLASFGLPLPLGGTSNHFRIKALRQLGGWDAHNVTEDADLGIRLARFGWRADVLDSSTFEEANNSFGNWLPQRARWLKGWIQTWFVHMRHPVDLWRQLGPAGFLVFQTLMAGIVVSTIVHPFFLAAIIWALFTGTLLPLEPTSLDTLLTGIGLAVFTSGYAVTLGAGHIALGLRGLGRLRVSVFAMPVYWILISIGGWLAVKQFITHPFHWNKTSHGLSKRGPINVRARRQN
ncbi:MAG TPA: glycosyltransferase, partial [Rhizobiales bacterium]|nr:glycosyltransferase [Hyphomicrobiales bacterium]